MLRQLSADTTGLELTRFLALVLATGRPVVGVVVLAGGLNALITRPCNNVDPRDGSEPTPEEDEYQQDRAHL